MSSKCPFCKCPYEQITVKIYKTIRVQLILNSVMLNVAELIDVGMSYQMWAE